MSKIVWDQTGERYLESGVSRGVLYKAVSFSGNEFDEDTMSYQRLNATMTSETFPGTNYKVFKYNLPTDYNLNDDAVLYFFGADNPTYLPAEPTGEYSSPDFPESMSFESSGDSHNYYPYIGKIGKKDWENLSALSQFGVKATSGAITEGGVNKLVFGYRSNGTGGYSMTFKQMFIVYSPSSNPTSNSRTMRGYAWNGLISVSSSPEGAEDNDQWADNMKYSRTKSRETWGGTIEAYQSPKEFDECDGSIEASPGVNVGQQKRDSFGLSYRTEIMSDASGGESCGYLLHILYNLTASPSERSYETINDSPDAITLSWELDGVPVNVEGYEPLTEITIDSRYANAEKLSILEDALYGSENGNSVLLSPEQVIDIMDPTPHIVVDSVKFGGDSCTKVSDDYYTRTRTMRNVGQEENTVVEVSYRIDGLPDNAVVTNYVYKQSTGELLQTLTGSNTNVRVYDINRDGALRTDGIATKFIYEIRTNITATGYRPKEILSTITVNAYPN